MDTQDPLVDEIHATREKLAGDAGNDMRKLVEMARGRQEGGQRPITSFSPKPVTASKRAS
jgi:hypothetical protein